MRVPRGVLTIDVGHIWSGKTSPINAVIGEMRAGGDTSVGVAGTVAFVSNTLWLRNTAVRHNVTVCAPLDETRLVAVVDGCRLAADFRALSWLAGRVSASVGSR